MIEVEIEDDAWIAVNGDVINVVKWISIHPGGEQASARILYGPFTIWVGTVLVGHCLHNISLF